MVNRRRREMTARQKMVLGAIENFILDHGEAPTIRGLGEILGISHPSAVFKHVKSLERKGYLKRAGGEIRMAELPVPAAAMLSVPMIGLVPAGNPREAFDAHQEALDVPEWMIGRKRGNIFCISVDGKSMVDAYIDDGDRVLVERTDAARSGEMVVALLDDGSVTLKRLKLDRDGAVLLPENPEFSPIKVKNLRVLGRVIGVLRKY